MENNTIADQNTSENDTDADQAPVEKKNILQKITDLPSWVWGLAGLLGALTIITLSSLNLLEKLMIYFYDLEIFGYLLPACGIIKGIIEIRSFKTKSGILGIILSLIASGLLITFYLV